jgi:glycosyltransferase involved in cell wall biosynthesis
MRRRTVVVAYAQLKESGLGRRLRRAMLALADAGHRVEYVCVRDPAIEHPNLRVRRLALPDRLGGDRPDHRRPLFWLAFMLAAGLWSLWLARPSRTPVLVAFSSGGALPLLPARLVYRAPLVVFLRSDELKEYESKDLSGWLARLSAASYQRVLRLAQRLVPVTKTLAQTVTRQLGGREVSIRVLYNDLLPPPDGAEARAALAQIAPADGPIAIMTAVYARRKNADLLLRALTSAPDLRLVLAGEGPSLEEHGSRARELGIADRVFFPGWRSDADLLVAAADLFVLPTLGEGMANSLLEALSAETACLVSDIPEHAELFGEGAPNLFDPDHPEQLAELLRRACEPSFREELRASGRSVAARLVFDWDAAVVEIVAGSA